MNDLAFFLAVFASVFALVDPFGALPFVVALTEGFTEAAKAAVVRRSSLVAGGVLVVFALFGRFLFLAFGFTLGAFEIAGGILLFLVSYDMVQGRVGRMRLTEADQTEAIERPDEVSIVPIGIPLLAGPGAISTVMIYAGYADGDPGAIIATFVAVVVVGVLTFVILLLGRRILGRLGRTGVMALTRVMGLVLAAVGVQFVVDGVFALGFHP